MFRLQIRMLPINSEVLGEVAATLGRPTPHITLDRDGASWLVDVDRHRCAEVCLHLQQIIRRKLRLCLLVNFIRMIFV